VEQEVTFKEISHKRHDCYVTEHWSAVGYMYSSGYCVKAICDIGVTEMAVTNFYWQKIANVNMTPGNRRALRPGL
jgi:hypothetical protein